MTDGKPYLLLLGVQPFSGAKDTVRMCSRYGSVAKLVFLTPDLDSTISEVQRNGEQGDTGLRSL